MLPERRIGQGIIASILTGVITTILGGAGLLCIEHRFPWLQPNKESREIEKKRTISVVQTDSPRPSAQPSIVSPPLTPAPQVLLEQLDEQRNEIEKLKRTLKKLEREDIRKRNSPPTPSSDDGPSAEKQHTRRTEASPTDASPAESSREQKSLSRSRAAPPSQPARTPLFYRVASQRARQLQDDQIEETVNFLAKLQLSYLRGPSYRDRLRGALYVPVAIRKSASWRIYEAKTVAHRERIMSKMLALGIEATVEQPEGIDD